MVLTTSTTLTITGKATAAITATITFVIGAALLITAFNSPTPDIIYIAFAYTAITFGLVLLEAGFNALTRIMH